MNYADTVLGTWYPMGGMHEIVRAMVRIAEKKGVRFHYNADVKCITDDGQKATGVELQDGTKWSARTVVAGADYHHVEQHLLPAQWRRYDQHYWDSRVMSPSSLLFYVGVDTRVPKLQHHNLFFDTPFGPHAETIYDTQTWPDDPLFYISAPSKTDSGIAPEGHENMFFLIPLAPGLKDEPGLRDRYFEEMCDRLANTLRQTAFWKPKMKSKLPGMFFTGQLTTPGPGVPPSLISGEVVGNEAHRWLLKLSDGRD